VLALAQYLPRLAARVPTVSLGEWPTPIVPLELDGRTLWVKDEGASNARYGGNKIRTLEMWFGHARERGAKRIWAIGAYGSNHAIATVIHAPTAGLEAGAILFPQPTSEWAVENCRALIASGVPIVRVPMALMPFVALRIARRERDAIVMPPGGATPIGTMGALSGALELATQIEEGRAPAPKRIVVGVGSTCTISGLVAGLSLAHAIGVWRWPVPIVHGVRVTPWPVTSPTLIADLAYRTLARIERLGGPRVATNRRELLSRLVIDGREIGRGYGRITERGDEASRTIVGHAAGGHAAGGHAAGGLRLDGVYSAKAAAGLLRLHRSGVGPLLFWASKSRALLSAPADDELRASHPALVRWLRG
jgi:D-cysteine desulfhydrase